jgi:hypothetical protein
VLTWYNTLPILQKEGDEEGEVEFSDKDDLIDNLKELEELISTLKSDLDLGGDEGMEGMEGEEEMEGMEGEEEEGDMPDIDTGEGEDEVHIDVDSHNDGEEDDSEEEMPKKKKSKKPEME